MIGRGVVGRAGLTQVLNGEDYASNALVDIRAGYAALAAAPWAESSPQRSRRYGS